MNAGTANDLPVEIIPLESVFQCLQSMAVAVAVLRQAAGYFIRTDTHGLGHILECIFRHRVIFALLATNHWWKDNLYPFSESIYR